MRTSARFFRQGLVWALNLVAASFSAARGEELTPQQRQLEFKQTIQPLLARYCYRCHGEKDPQGELRLTGFDSPEKILVGRKTWLKAVAKLQSEEMPPADAPVRPSRDERARLAAWLDAAVHAVDCRGSPEPGRVTIRRLTRLEYRNTVRDLTGVDYEPARDFPADDSGYGFDNIGDVLSLPPILLEKYLAAAEAIADQAILARGPVAPLDKRVAGAQLQGKDGHRVGALSQALVSEGELSATFEAPLAGNYEIRVLAYGDQAGPEPVRMAVQVDGKPVEKFEVKVRQEDAREYATEARLAAGRRRIGAAFLNDYYRPDAKNEADRDRNLIVSAIHVRGPLDALPELPASHRQLVFARPEGRVTWREAAEKVIRRLASRAFRRPVTDREAERLVDLAEEARRDGQTFDQGIQLALQAVLVSPHFLFHVEADPPGREGAPRDLTDFELATRLSYFLWSSMPDDELFHHAWKGTLRQDDNLARQTRRMLTDSKARALVENFGGQWLQLRSLDIRTPDRQLFPTVNEALKAAMRRETELFFESIVREDRSVLDLLTADYTFVNEALAKHYGLPGVRGAEFRRVSLAGTQRAGILSQASILTITSNPNRTSPVKRGKWILENLLGTPPPPAPPNVPELEDANRTELKGTLRQRMEQHRVNPACATCHQQMDPLGFALENFDAVGRFRTHEGEDPIDASGQLPSGEKFRGPAEMRQLLAARRDQFTACLAEKLLTYALGRGLEYYDQCVVDRLTASLKQQDDRFSALVLGIVHSPPFQKQGAVRSEP